MNWTEKYRPETLKEYEDSLGIYDPIIRWVKEWSRDWTERRFAILHGKPGTGKTTIVEAIARDMDLELYITNASEDRNSNDIVDAWRISMMKGMFGNGRLIVLDESDHISNQRSGRGKSAQDYVLEMTRKSFYPVILICNDLYSLDKSIRNAKPFRLKFDYPRMTEKIQIAHRVVSAEGLDMSPHEIDIVVRSSKTFRSLLYNLQKASLGVFEFDPDVVNEDIFEEFMNILNGDAPKKSNFTPDDLMKWMIEFIPSESDKMMKVNNILGRISGERYTTDMHDHAWKYSNILLRTCRARVDFNDRTVNGRKVKLPFDSMIAAKKIKKEILSSKPKDNEKVKKTQKSKIKSNKQKTETTTDNTNDLSKFF